MGKGNEAGNHVVYKVAYEQDGKFYSCSLHTSHSFCVRYIIDRVAIPVHPNSLLFAFDSDAFATKFIGYKPDLVILECEAEIGQYQDFNCYSAFWFNEWWDGNREIRHKFAAKNYPGTLFCNWIKPLSLWRDSWKNCTSSS